MQVAGLEQVLDSQRDVGRVERLGDELACSEPQRLSPYLGRAVTREDGDREIGVCRNRLRELREHPEAVESRHVEVEEDQVGLDGPIELRRLQRVSRGV